MDHLLQLEQFPNVTLPYELPSGGILTTFVINSILALFMVLFFCTCLRRLAIFNITKKRRLYKEAFATTTDNPPLPAAEPSGFLPWIQKQIFNLVYVLRTFIPSYGNQDTQFLFKEYGREAAIYILFERYLIIAMASCTVISLIVIFPLHTTGHIPGIDKFNLTETNVLMQTSIIMIMDVPWKLYFHVVLAIVFTFIMIFWIYRFEQSDPVSDPNFAGSDESIQHLIAKQSIQMDRINPEWSNNDFEKFCYKLFPEKVLHCTILWDVSSRLELDKKIKKTKKNLEHYQYVSKTLKKRPYSWTGIDYLEYYEKKLVKLTKEALRWDSKYQKVLAGEDHMVHDIKSTRKGFITFRSVQDAQECLMIREYQFKQANEPNDINWQNLCTHRNLDLFREVVSHAVMIVICIFFTTPIAMTSSIENFAQLPVVNEVIRNLRALTGIWGDIIFQYLPSLIVMLITILFSVIVAGITKLAKYKTLSKYQRMVLFRMYIYLVLSTFLMPAFLLTSVDGVINYLREGNVVEMFRLIFLPSNGAFFINLVLQFILLRNFQDLIRLYDVIVFFFSSCRSVTPKERFEAAEEPYFAYSLEYAFLMTVMCIILCLSLFSPLILLFGLVFFISKHFFDRYNIKLIYKTKIAKPNQTSFSSHQKTTRLLIKIYWFNLILFVTFVFIFFVLKITANAIFVSHFVVILFFLIFIMVYFLILAVKTNPVLVNKESTELIQQKIKDEEVKSAYLPPIDYMTKKNDKYQMEIDEMFVE